LPTTPPTQEPPTFGDQPSTFEDDTGTKRWYIETDRQAAWAAAKYLAAEDDLEAADRELAAYQADLRLWYEQRTAESKLESAHWKALLDVYALQVREHTGKKSFGLPNAMVSTTETPAYPKVADEAVLLHWLASHPALEAVVTTRKVVAVPFKNAVRLESGHAQAVLACGCVVDFTPPLSDDTAEALCPSCRQAGSIVERRMPVVRVLDKAGAPVPGTTVEPTKVTVSVKPRKK